VKSDGGVFSIGNGKKYQDKLSKKQWQDLIDFEGNANGFSVLTASRPGIEARRFLCDSRRFYEISKRVCQNQLTTYQTKVRFLPNR
jgi:hypothetical protein